MLTDFNAARLQFARDAISGQVAERNRDFPHCAPGAPWNRVTKLLGYFLALPPEHLQNARLHSDLFLGSHFQDYVFIDPTNSAAVAQLNDPHGYSWMGEGVDRRLWASEPPVDALDGPLGYDIDGRVVNDVIAVLQRYVCNLLRLGLSDGDSVVEIGAGYGGLAHAVLSARACRYTIIDLPETLIYSASFLTTHFQNKSIYVYKPGDDPGRIEWASYDLVFLPDYRSDWLRLMPRFNWAINTVSFPEMGREALVHYVDLLADVLDGPLMSVNHHRDIRGDDQCVTDFLARRFALCPPPDQIRAALKMTTVEYDMQAFRPTILCLPPTFDRKRLAGAEMRDVVHSNRFRRVVTQFAVRDVSVFQATY